MEETRETAVASRLDRMLFFLLEGTLLQCEL
jgi:hypothetical protein